MSAAPRPQVGFSTQPCIDWIHPYVVRAPVQIVIISDQMIVRFALPERDDFLGQHFVQFMRRVGFPRVQDFAQGARRFWPNNHMNVIRHDRPCAQFVPFPVKEFQRASDNVRACRAAQMTFPVAAIKVAIHAI